MSKAERGILTSFVFVAGAIFMYASAMHIMKGFLPLSYCVAWGALCPAFLVMGAISIRKTIQKHQKTL